MFEDETMKVHCNLKENAELIAKVLDADVANEAYVTEAKWIVFRPPTENKGPIYKCSNCTAKYEHIENKRYCPWCGKLMNTYFESEVLKEFFESAKAGF